MISLLFSFHSSWPLKKPASSPRRSSAAVRTLLTVMGSTSALRTMSRSVFPRMASGGGVVSDSPDLDDMVAQSKCCGCGCDIDYLVGPLVEDASQIHFTRSCPTFDVSECLPPSPCAEVCNAHSYKNAQCSREFNCSQGDAAFSRLSLDVSSIGK